MISMTSSKELLAQLVLEFIGFNNIHHIDIFFSSFRRESRVLLAVWEVGDP